MDDIMALDDGSEDEAAFMPADALSRFNDSAYRLLARPWVKAWVNEANAEALRQLHPLRVFRYGLSDLNPWMAPLKQAAKGVKAQRQPVSPDNPFLAMETMVSDAISRGLNLYRDFRDGVLESWFYAVYDNPWVRAMSPDRYLAGKATPTECRPQWLDRIDAGGFPEAVVRIMVLLASDDCVTCRQNLTAYKCLADQDERLKALEGGGLSEMIWRQSCIVTCDREGARTSLPRMLPEKNDRKKALAIAADLLIGTTSADAKMLKAHAAVADLLGCTPDSHR